MMALVIGGRPVGLGELSTLAVPRARLGALTLARVALARGRGRRLGQTGNPATDPHAWAALAATLNPGSAFYQEVSGCAQNPTADCYALAPGWFSSGANTGGGPALPSGPLPTLAFSVSSGNTSSPAVGESWTVSISGSPAWAGFPVTVYGSTGPSTGVRAESLEGNLDSNGNFQTSGQFTAGQVGAWYEDWKVAGRVVGNWSFTVAPASSGPTAAPPAATPIYTMAPAPGPPAAASSFFSSLPWWVWVGGGGLALYAFSGGRGRH